MQLFRLFNQVGPVLSVRVCKDMVGRSLGYGYVNYVRPHDADNAIKHLNFFELNEKRIRIMYSQRDPSLRRSGAGNLFVKNLPYGFDHKALNDMFATFGDIMSCKLVTDNAGHSKGYGFVHFTTLEAAQNAMETLHGTVINNKKLHVAPLVRRQDRAQANTKADQFTNVYVKNLGHATTEDDLRRIFGEFGQVTSVVVIRDADGKSKRFGFINYVNPDDAARAVEGLNGIVGYVGRAQKKSERRGILRNKFQQAMTRRFEQGCNLYVTNLDDGFGENQLKEVFSPFGTITSCKVMRYSDGASRCSGFVAFSTLEEANKAIKEMDGKIIGSKQVYVSVAQEKRHRRNIVEV
ncbi:Polyadenylate-binding protein 2 [Linum grandiflorum]